MEPTRNVIVIGAGRGGVESLRRVLASMAPPLPAVLLGLAHQPAPGAGTAGGILGGSTRLPVSYATQGGSIHTGEVYLAPPGCHLTVDAEGRTSLDGGERLMRIGRPAIDLLFQSAAAAFGGRVIGVVLSGADGDGTDGLRAIKAAGGLSVVQSPADASVPDMPSSALLGDNPDHCVLLEQIGPLLLRLVRSDTAN
ncbi:MAG: protein-glutamate methylesterase [Variovorax sp.]|jgi:two-component system chemotaxis response regulator CheB|nr:protein-glutamate methylesterase [Variovorax sp.]